jgi:hypothetical protein
MAFIMTEDCWKSWWRQTNSVPDKIALEKEEEVVEEEELNLG